MVGVTIDVKFDKLPTLGPALRARAAVVVEESARVCEGWAKVFVPVDTGATRTSIDSQPEDELTWVVAPHTDYAIWLELGNHGRAPRPFMNQAAEATKPRFVGEMEKIVEEAARD
jgi:HK97 gp10 family phage protein